MSSVLSDLPGDTILVVLALLKGEVVACRLGKIGRADVLWRFSVVDRLRSRRVRVSNASTAAVESRKEERRALNLMFTSYWYWLKLLNVGGRPPRLKRDTPGERPTAVSREESSARIPGYIIYIHILCPSRSFLPRYGHLSRASPHVHRARQTAGKVALTLQDDDMRRGSHGSQLPFEWLGRIVVAMKHCTALQLPDRHLRPYGTARTAFLAPAKEGSWQYLATNLLHLSSDCWMFRASSLGPYRRTYTAFTCRVSSRVEVGNSRSVGYCR
jgi:hypothetical protein